MTLSSSIYRAAFCLNRKAEFLGDCIRQRRLELGISIAEAADLSGITMWQWAALEHGLWLPEDGPVMRSIAGTLEADYPALAFCALVSRLNPPEQQVIQ